MRISDWSSDVCSSDLTHLLGQSDCLTPAPFQRDIERSARPGQRRLPLQRAVDAQIGGIASLLDLRDQRRSRQTRLPEMIGRASCRERVCQDVVISVVAVSLKKKKYSLTIEIVT